jgi:hypothetical protein
MRAIVLILGFVLPSLLVGGVIARGPGAMTGAFLGSLILVLFGLTARRTLLRASGPVVPASSGLTASVHRVAVEELGQDVAPKMLESLSPQPNAWTLCGRGGARTLVLSRGLLALLSEEELRAVLGKLVAEPAFGRIRLRMICASIAVRLLKLAPREWVSLTLAGSRPDPGSFRFAASPLRFARFLMIYPWARLVMSIGGRGPDHALSDSDPMAWNIAMRKIRSHVYSSDFVGHPALSSLYLCPPQPVSEGLRLGGASLVSRGHQG